MLGARPNFFVAPRGTTLVSLSLRPRARPPPSPTPVPRRAMDLRADLARLTVAIPRAVLRGRNPCLQVLRRAAHALDGASLNALREGAEALRRLRREATTWNASVARLTRAWCPPPTRKRPRPASPRGGDRPRSPPSTRTRAMKRASIARSYSSRMASASRRASSHARSTARRHARSAEGERGSMLVRAHRRSSSRRRRRTTSIRVPARRGGPALGASATRRWAAYARSR